jgi:hypothetical protein
MKQFNEKLIDQRLITRSQYEYLHRVNSKEIISVYSEIRTILYLGVLLFTTGIGYFTYQNIGEFGHITLMAFILALILIACFYSFKKVPPYTHDIQVAPNPYFDYVVLFETVLTLSLFTYIHAYFELPRYLVKPTTLLSSVMLFFTAYRFDHRGILNMGLTTLAAFCGLSISPSKLEFENILKDTSLSLTGIVFALSLIGLNYFFYGLPAIRRKHGLCLFRSCFFNDSSIYF